MFFKDTLLLLCIVPVAGLVTLLDPVWGGGVLVAGLTAGALFYRLLAAPSVILGMTLGVYLLIGGVNISSYRGEVYAPFLQIMVWLVLSLLAGFAFGNIFPALLHWRGDVGLSPLTPPFTPRSCRHPPPALSRPSSLLVWTSAIPGFIGIFWMLLDVRTIPLFVPEARFAIDPKSQLLIETLFIPLILRTLSLFCVCENDGRHGGADHCRRGGWEIVFWIFLLALSGYRGWVIEAIGLVSLTALTVRSGRRPFLFAVGGAVVSLATLVVVALYRRMTQDGLFRPAESLRMHGAEDLPQILAQIHFTARESLYVAQELWRMRIDDLAITPSLLFADLLTVLPGKQPAAGDLLGDMFGRTLAGGLTASFPGVLYYEAGGWAFPVMAGIGSGFGWWWWKIMFTRKIDLTDSGNPLAPSPSFVANVASYYLVFILFLHLFHRGTIKPSYIVLPAILWGALWVWQRLSSGRDDLCSLSPAKQKEGVATE